ncbi:MAG TPA: UDP-galactopyranose mutase [Niabella sp.]|nr:UDP-galactopyranose mutase [Bacteroidia bacterium]HOZ91039.1 UDP-galactopyranose mutase [Bacteroidia bacterium]HRB52059.1 UDP-galactopyranose mutase [Bacteroidia bacterium]HRC03127.1 UDP-galactopyranose mutase [Niabella sp.]
MNYLEKYDYLIVGSGLFGSTFAERMHRKGKRVLIIEKRNHIGGNVWTEEMNGIHVHKYGPHIFHTNSEDVWTYVNRFCKWRQFQYSPIANYNGELYSLPFNLHTFYQFYGIKTPAELQSKIEQITSKYQKPSYDNVEDFALAMLGEDLYRKLIYGYTKKQWNAEPVTISKSIIARLPIRQMFDSNYFNDLHQAIPVGGYAELVTNMTKKIEVIKNTDFLSAKKEFENIAEKVIYTGSIDEYYGYELGELEYRSLRFETEQLPTENYQGVAVMNYTDEHTPFTRVIEHKHFERMQSKSTVITKEFPAEWKKGMERFYPVNTEMNNALLQKYKKITNKNTLFGGRLGSYQYYNMDQIIASALKLSNSL